MTQSATRRGTVSASCLFLLIPLRIEVLKMLVVTALLRYINTLNSAAVFQGMSTSHAAKSGMRLYANRGTAVVSVNQPFPGTQHVGRTPIEGSTSSRLLVLFVLTLLMPIAFEIAGTRLSPNRLFLLISIIPFAVRIISGQIGRLTLVDLFFLLHGIWIFVSLIVVEGTSRIPFAGITAVELVGGYFVGRALVTNADDYRRLFKMVLLALICLLPFAIFESFTGRMLIPDLLRPVFETPHRGRSAYGRMGLERVYGVFSHPILWGLFCALSMANFVALARGNIGKIIFALLFTLYTTFLSLSSAPLMAYGLQLCLLVWGWVMGGRWKILLICSVVGYVVIDLLSNRTPVTILIDTLTFNPGTGYTRIAIFDAGWAAVKGSPLFGIGFNDWPRPSWVTASVDNFWLLTAMRYGMVGVGFLILAFLSHFYLLARAKITDPETAAIRVGHAIALAGVSFTLTTVHIWDTIAVFVMFYIGAGAWMYAFDPVEQSAEGSPQAAPEPQGGNRYSRFPQHSKPQARPQSTPQRAPRHSRMTTGKSQ